MDEIDNFMVMWEQKAIAYYTDLNKRFQKLKKTHKQEGDDYRKQHGIPQYTMTPLNMQHYRGEMDFLRTTVGNITMENLIRCDGHASRFKNKLSKQIKKESEKKKKNLLDRIQKKIGEIVIAKLKIGANSELNGTIEGKKGKVKVETIYAGGYNIQCLHFRVLIHDLKF